MRAILINPELRRIGFTKLRNGPKLLDEMRRIIGCGAMDHTFISDMRDDLWLADDGLQRGEPVWAFKLRIMRDPLAGRAILIGTDERGCTKPPFFPIEVLRREVEWLGLIKPEVTWIEESPRHSRAVVTYSRVR